MQLMIQVNALRQMGRLFLRMSFTEEMRSSRPGVHPLELARKDVIYSGSNFLASKKTVMTAENAIMLTQINSGFARAFSI